MRPIVKSKSNRSKKRNFVNSRQSAGVSTIEISDNAKLGTCGATYVAQASCPIDCPFYSNGCYGDYGYTAIHWSRLRAQAEEGRLTALGLAKAEASLIEQMSGSFPLRLHVVGDSTTRAGTRTLAQAAAKFTKKKGMKVWTYTHAWRTVPRSDWGGISVLASCEGLEGVKQATKQGYASSMVVGEFSSEKAYPIGDGYKLVPCPAQTTEATCASCRLCWNDTRLRDHKLVIGFEAHGSGKRLVRMALPVVG